MNPTTRRRAAAVAAMLCVIALGLASRRWPGALPAVFGKYPGDALWATMVVLGWCALRPGARTREIALLAALTCVTVEVAKLWQAPWLVAFRHTPVGHLLLGHAFSWQNLVAYGAGVLAGLLIVGLLPAPGSPTMRAAHS